MKWVGVFLLGVGLSSAVAEDMGALEKCLRGVRADFEFYRRVIPPGIYSMDRRLYRMSFGIPLIEENAGILKKRISSGGVSEAERQVVFNATQGCETFHDNYRRRIRQFLSLSGCIITLMSLLTLRALSTIFASEKRKTDAPILPATPVATEPVDRPEKSRR